MTTEVKIIKLIIVSTIILIAASMYGCPKYNLYTARMDGEATLAKAQSTRSVAVAEAKAKMESASLLAQADIMRAKGAAHANKIIGDSLKNNEAYLRYLWIQNIENSSGQIIYVPTEANLPILEATRKSEDRKQ